MEAINRISKMAEDIDHNIADALDNLNKYQEVPFDVLMANCMSDLLNAQHTAITIQIAMKYLNEYLEKVEELLNDRNYQERRDHHTLNKSRSK